jgi:intermembrane space import and assembly protein 40
MATGPCGVEFREAFSCCHYSEAEPKGSDCYEAFTTMQDCMAQYGTVWHSMAQYPALHSRDGDDDDDDDELESPVDANTDKEESKENTETAVTSSESSY